MGWNLQKSCFNWLLWWLYQLINHIQGTKSTICTHEWPEVFKKHLKKRFAVTPRKTTPVLWAPLTKIFHFGRIYFLFFSLLKPCKINCFCFFVLFCFVCLFVFFLFKSKEICLKVLKNNWTYIFKNFSQKNVRFFLEILVILVESFLLPERKKILGNKSRPTDPTWKVCPHIKRVSFLRGLMSKQKPLLGCSCHQILPPKKDFSKSIP